MSYINPNTLRFFKQCKELVIYLYELTNNFPKEEFNSGGLVGQIRRASISVVSNIAEGTSRKEKQFNYFLSISIGSLKEIEVQLEISKKLKFISEKDYWKASRKIDICIRKMINYSNKLEK